MSNLHDVVQSLVKSEMGSGDDPDQQRILLGLSEYSKAQQRQGLILGLLLLVLLVAPIVILLTSDKPNLTPYLFGTSGLFSIGTMRILLTTYQDISRAHTLAIVCQGMNSKDTKDVLNRWLRGKG